MKQEHEMTPGVLVPDDMAAGDYKARCAVLEAEVAELRKRVQHYTTPQPAPTACTGKNCGSTDPNLHSADCFAEHEQAIAPAAAQDVAGVIPRPVIDWAETGALDCRDSWSTRINGHTVGLHSDEERARNHAWALEAYLGVHKIIAAHQQGKEGEC